jgi:hypothetical protein
MKSKTSSAFDPKSEPKSGKKKKVHSLRKFRFNAETNFNENTNISAKKLFKILDEGVHGQENAKKVNIY